MNFIDFNSNEEKYQEKWIKPAMVVKRRKFNKSNKETYIRRKLVYPWLNSFLLVFNKIFINVIK